jgi:hypothetical protein
MPNKPLICRHCNEYWGLYFIFEDADDRENWLAAFRLFGCTAMDHRYANGKATDPMVICNKRVPDYQLKKEDYKCDELI